MEPIYTPTDGKLMRVVVFFSGSASSLEYLLLHDSNFGKNYEVVGAVSDREGASGIDLCLQNNIQVELINFKEFLHSNGANFSDHVIRDQYFTKLKQRVDQWAPDIIMLSGWMLITSPNFIAHYKHRILNVHPADLRILSPDGSRKYTGLHVVERAISDGEEATYSTVHIVTEGVDEGPILTVSEPLPVEGRSSSEQQELMKKHCDGPAYQKAINLIADGKVYVNDDSSALEVRAD